MRLSKQHEIQCLQQGILQLISRFSTFQEVSARVCGVLRAPLRSSAEERAQPAEVDVCKGWRSRAGCRDPAWAAGLGSTTLNGGSLGPPSEDGRVMGGRGYLNSWLSCAFPPRCPPEAHPSWQLSHVDVGQYSEKLSRAGVLPPPPWFSGEVGARLPWSPRLESLDGKSTNQRVSAQGVQEPQPTSLPVITTSEDLLDTLLFEQRFLRWNEHPCHPACRAQRKGLVTCRCAGVHIQMAGQA